MTLRVTVYGILKPSDREYALVDMVYFLDDSQYITISDVMQAIEYEGSRLLPLRYPDTHPLHGNVVRDKVTIEPITIGIEPVNPIGENQENYETGGY